jgi:hypothetical protein
MSNRLFQGLIHQMKDTIDRVIGVVDDQANIIACSELSKIGLTNEFISLENAILMILLSGTDTPTNHSVSTLNRIMPSLWKALTILR